MKHFLIYTNKNKDKDLKTTESIRAYLTDRGQRVTVKEAEWKNKTCNLADAMAEACDIPESIDCMIVLGGDGTVLQAARDTKSMGIPIIGFNLGTLGYMTELDAGNLEEGLDRLIAGDYEEQSRMMIKGKVFHTSGETEEGWALNDIVVSRSGSLQIIKFVVRVNGQFLHEYNADGMIVTTPTGSTGYNLSAGGPIVEPGSKLIVLTPICPHTLIQRSIALASDDVVEIEIPMGREDMPQTVEVHFDGSHRIILQTGDRIRIVKSEESIKFVQLNQVSFLEVLHKKMREA